jgi:arginyl-tRNA synthetase
VDLGDVDAGLATSLDTARGHELVRLLADYPGEVAVAARRREPARLTRFLEEVAEGFHRFLGSVRVLPQGDDEPTDVHRERLLLVEATRVVVGCGLDLLGVVAPVRM